MSINSKKTQNYSALLGELKGSINDKIKGRNYKSYMKRAPTTNNDKSELIGMKSIQNLNTGSNLMESSKINNIIDKRILDKRKNTINTNIDQLGNKIDIKISVNYGKQNSNNSTLNNINSNGLPSSKSKSFYQSNANTNLNSLTSNSNNLHTPTNGLTGKDEFLMNSQINFDKSEASGKEKLIKSLKTSMNEEKFMRKKIIENKEDYSTSLNHKRNQSDNNYYNNLNISLMNYENKPQIHNYFNSSKGMNQNNSFTYNNQLFNHFKTSMITPQKEKSSNKINFNF